MNQTSLQTISFAWGSRLIFFFLILRFLHRPIVSYELNISSGAMGIHFVFLRFKSYARKDFLWKWLFTFSYFQNMYLLYYFQRLTKAHVNQREWLSASESEWIFSVIQIQKSHVTRENQNHYLWVNDSSTQPQFWAHWAKFMMPSGSL